MRVGVPKEIKNHEYRVGLTPPSVAELVAAGHEVFVETQAGMGIDFDDEDYVAAGATILPDAASVFAGSRHDREGEGAAGQRDRDAGAAPPALHLPPPRRRQAAGGGTDEVGRDLHRLRDRDRSQGRAPAAEADVARSPAACRYRSARITSKRNRAAAACCSAACPASRPAKVAILGGGVSGVNAAQMAVGMRADVTIYDISMDRLAELDMFFSQPDQDRLCLASRRSRRR